MKKLIIAVITLLTGVMVLISPYLFVLEKKEIAYSMPQITQNSVGVYIINLDRSADRYQRLLPLVKDLRLPHTRIPAIDGSQLHESELRDKVDNQAYLNFLGQPYLMGTIGCSLSHIKTWQTFLESPYNYALILEDDVSFRPDELSPLIERLQEASDLWDICSFDLLHHGWPLTVKEFGDGGNRLCVYLLKVTHAGAYLINRKAALSLLEHAHPIKMPVDYYFTRSWELKLKFTGIEPRLVQQTFGHSTIDASPRAKGESSLSSKLHKGLFTLAEGVMQLVTALQSYFAPATQVN